MRATTRYPQNVITEALQKKMAFIGGPRQVGKTTLALSLLGLDAGTKHPAYLNWDQPLIAAKIRRLELPPNEQRLIFDEIHKYSRWRNLIKGIYDTERSHRQIIVTGSARLDFYRRGGDSLVGRYRYFRLHPFSLNELASHPSSEGLDLLMRFGGFPEPLFQQKENELRIWQRDRLTHVVREDLRDLERVRDISLIEELVDMLPDRVSSLLSVKSLCEDLQVDHKTVEHWLQILTNLYVCYRIPPYGAPRVRAIKKAQKLFLWDWSMIADEGRRFENLVASQLLKFCHFKEDTEGHRMELRFLRDLDQREVDFVVLQNKKPVFAVECKSGDKAISPSVHYFAARTNIPKFYQVHRGHKHFESGNIAVVPFTRFCQDLKLP